MFCYCLLPSIKCQQVLVFPSELAKVLGSVHHVLP